MKQIQNIPSNIMDAAKALLDPYFNLTALLERTQEPQKRYITIAEAEESFGITRWTLGRMIRAGKISAIKLAQAKSGKVLIDYGSLASYLESCRQNISSRVAQ